MERILSELSKHSGKKNKDLDILISRQDAMQYNAAVLHMFKNKSEPPYIVWMSNRVTFIFS